MSSLSCADRAAFAVTSRLLASLITESLLKAFFIPTSTDLAAGTCIVLSKQASDAGVQLDKIYSSTDIFAIILLRGLPVLKSGVHAGFYREIGLVDPLDMLPLIYEIKDGVNERAKQATHVPSILSSLPLPCLNSAEKPTFSVVLDPICMWNKFHSTSGFHWAPDQITEELRSSLLWQQHTYENCPRRPTLSTPRIEWEHALIEGHPTHPMHRERWPLPPTPTITPGGYDFYQPRVRFALVPRDNIQVQGNFENLLTSLRAEAARNAGRPIYVRKGCILVPVHEVQVANIEAYFADAEILPEEFSIVAPAQASLRTVTLPCSPHLTLKLALGIKISSSLRTISHFTAYAGPRFGEQVLPKLAIDHNILKIEREVASVVHTHKNPEIAKHCTAIIREVYHGDANGEQVIMASSLMEVAYGDFQSAVPAVVTALGLDTKDKKFAFLEQYIDLIFDAFLPPLLKNGVAFEAHGQNTLTRFDRKSGQLLGFVFRDFGGLRIHSPTLHASTGIAIDTLPNHYILVADVKDAYRRLYHALIHCHLQRLIRVLGFHYNGRGWMRVRESLEARIPRGSDLWCEWLDPTRRTVMVKSLFRMKINGPSRDTLYEAMPNLIHFRPQDGIVGRENDRCRCR